MYQPPDKDRLKSDAGWALFRRSDVSPEGALALDKFREGCESLMPYADGIPVGADVAEKDVSASIGGGSVKLPSPVRATPPPIVQHPSEVVTCENGGNHHFSIYDQHCSYCGKSRFRVLADRGRKPELIEP